MAQTKYPANVVGPEIQKRRKAMGLTQEQFAARCQLRGLNFSRGIVSQVEARLRCVRDSELRLLALVLRTSADSLFQRSWPRGGPKRKR